MERGWMSANRLTKDYEDGVEEFINFAIQHAENQQRIMCPCVRCGNMERLSSGEIRDHLYVHGIDRSYTRWIWHGESKEKTTDNSVCNEAFDDFEHDTLEDMINAAKENVSEKPEMFEQLLSDAEKPLYKGCSKFTRLSAVLKLYNLKAGNGWTDKSFTALLKLLKEMLPDDNVLPCRTYEAKMVLRSMGMDYIKIHACPNDCVLYTNEYASLDNCPNTDCQAPRYKKPMVPAKVLWYFPIIPRFRRMYGCQTDAKNLTWHENERVKDGKLRHPADSPQWEYIDMTFSDFGNEARNLRLALSTDGMNPHGSMSNSYSIWPVFLVIYNLPPWLCMKRKYMMLSLLISGPKQPGNDIDVYLAPLIDDLKLLWNEGMEIFDAYRKETFRMRAMLFCTINDFPAYGNLAGYSVKGHNACPICEDGTSFQQLKHSRKTVYLGHRRFLPMNHHYRRLRKAFNGSPEESRAPIMLTGEQIFEKIKDLNVTYGKKSRNQVPTSGWKKMSVFFELPYWKLLFVRHCLDVMHIEKNICDSLTSTLLNVSGKSKDGIKSRMDLVDMGIRGELTPIEKGARTYLPPASHTLSKKEKLQFCEFLHSVKVPEGHCSNIKNFVSMKDLKLMGMKSHDCHILMQQLLPVALRSILPKRVRFSITKLCLFFNSICSNVIDPEELDFMQSEVVTTLCQLEMYFPPSFFDIMIHLTVHLVNEVKLCGPVYLRWMYPFERYMKVLKGYVKNRNRPEGCIAERYITEEAVEFCSEYLSGVEMIGLPKVQDCGIKDGGISGSRTHSISRDMWHCAHLYVLHNDGDVAPYVEMHLNHIRSLFRHKSEKWIADEHNRCFINWLSARVLQELECSPQSVSNRLKWLSIGPRMEVASYSGYRINGILFYTKDQDSKSVMQNSGVTLVAEAMHISSAKDKNPIYAKMQYYGVIKHIWELDYTMFKVPVFCCDWVDNNNGVRSDDFGFILVDLKKLGHKNDPFIIASQAKQVFYVSDPADKRWSVVLTIKKRYPNDDDDPSDIIQDTPFSNVPSLDNDDIDDIRYVRDDHCEGIWIGDSKRKHKEN